MRRIDVVLLAVCLAAGCTAAEEQRVASAPVQVALHLDSPAGRADVPTDGDAAASLTGAPNADDPVATAIGGIAGSTPPTAESVAAGELVRLLELEGLFVLNLRPEVQLSDEKTTVVHVGVVYSTGQSHPTSATYRVTVHLDGRQLTVTSIEDLHGGFRS